MFAHRYECQEDTSGTWSVIDTLTGRVCEIGYRDVCRLRERDALEMTEVLNEHPLATLARTIGPFHSSIYDQLKTTETGDAWTRHA